MFNAAYKRSNIANAGQTSALTDALKVASAYSFDAFDLAESSMKANAAKYVSKKQEEAKRNYYKTTGEAELDALNTIQDANADYAGKTRMAGLVSTLGGLAYGTSRYFDNKNNRPPAPKEAPTADYSSQFEALENQGLKIDQQLEELRSKLKGGSSGTKPTNTASGTSVSTVASASTPKPLGGGEGWSALGATLKFAEGTYRQGDKAYNTGFGYEMFDDLSKHPDKVFGGVSAAAGAYQFMPKTWKTVVQPNLNLPDFSPASQEKAGEFLTNNRGVSTAKPFKTVSELRSAFDRLAPEWASIPLSTTGKSYYDGDGINSAKSFDSLRKFYESQVGYKLTD